MIFILLRRSQRRSHNRKLNFETSTLFERFLMVFSINLNSSFKDFFYDIANMCAVEVYGLLEYSSLFLPILHLLDPIFYSHASIFHVSSYTSINVGNIKSNNISTIAEGKIYIDDRK